MSKNLHIKGAFGKDYQELFVDDKRTGVFINEDGQVKINNAVIQNEALFANESLQIQRGDKYTSAGSANLSTAIVNRNGDLVIDTNGDMYFETDGGQFYIKKSNLYASVLNIDTENRKITFSDATSAADLFKIEVDTNGESTISTEDFGGTSAHLNISPDGVVKITKNVYLDATKKLYIDGGGDTYIYEASVDEVRYVVGGDVTMIVKENGDDGNQVNFNDASVGFTQKTVTYDATSTNVDFRHSNKQHLTFDSGNITNVNLYFPDMSGNFVLLLKQDGTGSRTVTNWKTYEYDESTTDGVAGVIWAGGSAPTLTTGANKVDILSFYYDAENEKVYGVASLDFAS